MRYAVLVITMVLLTGCYESKGFLLDPNEPRQPIVVEQDWTYGSGDKRYHARLIPRADGWYNYQEAKIEADGRDGDGRIHTVLVNFLTNANGHDVYIYGAWDDAEEAYFYGLMVMDGHGAWQAVTPNCDPMGGNAAWVAQDIAAARQAGAETKTADGAEPVCRFSTPAALRKAMQNIVNTPDFWVRVRAAAK